LNEGGVQREDALVLITAVDVPRLRGLPSKVGGVGAGDGGGVDGEREVISGGGHSHGGGGAARSSRAYGGLR
jgi:hypothetical protein